MAADLPEKEMLSTGDLATACHVTKHTIIAAIVRQELTASQTPGGHYRIRRCDAIDFLRQHNLIPAGEVKRRILVVDDEPYVATVVREILPKDAFDIYEARTGYEAGIWTERVRPDLILLDFLLPDVDGREVCRHIRSEAFGRQTRILAVTSVKHPEVEAEVLATGFDSYLAKPFRIEELRTAILALLPAEAELCQSAN